MLLAAFSGDVVEELGVWAVRLGLPGSRGGYKSLVTLPFSLPQSVPQECGDYSVTSSATVATAVPVILRVGRAFAPLACSPPTAFSPALLATMVLPASLIASAMEHPVTLRMEPASALQEEQDPGM